MDKNTGKGHKEKQTDLTRKQTVMANERTYNSWIRTGLTALVGGLFIARFLGEGDKSPVVTAIGIILILSSMGFYVLGYFRYKEDYERLKGKEAKRSMPKWIMFGTILALIFSAVLSLGLIYKYATA